ncbi:MAG: hypothetical protein QGH15_21395 [Kiritimatiellia bacterium]|nr:hypothetical protein [Kiritimatiellia bacterium]
MRYDTNDVADGIPDRAPTHALVDITIQKKPMLTRRQLSNGAYAASTERGRGFVKYLVRGFCKADPTDLNPEGGNLDRQNVLSIHVTVINEKGKLRTWWRRIYSNDCNICRPISTHAFVTILNDNLRPGRIISVENKLINRRSRQATFRHVVCRSHKKRIAIGTTRSDPSRTH